MFTIQSNNLQEYTMNPFQMIHPNQMIQPQMDQYQQQMNSYQMMIHGRSIMNPYSMNQLNYYQSRPLTSQEVDQMIQKPIIPNKFSGVPETTQMVQNNNYGGYYGNNIVGFGTYGYNNMYIPNNQYGNYYNPYLEQMKYQQQQIMMREQWMQQAHIYKMMSRISHPDMSEEEFAIHSKQYDPPNEEDIKQQIEFQQDYTDFLKGFHLYYNTRPPINYFVLNINQEIMRVKSMFPDDMNVWEWFSKSGMVQQDMLMWKMNHQRTDLRRLYNSNQYRSLIDQYTTPGRSYFESMFVKKNPDGTDTLEIKLPEDMRIAYEERKQKFMETLLK